MDKFDVLRKSQRRMRMDGMGAGPEPLPAEFEDLTEEQLASLPAADVDAEGHLMDKTTSPRAEAGGPGETPEEIMRTYDSASARRREIRNTKDANYPDMFAAELRRLVPGAKKIGALSHENVDKSDVYAEAPLIVALHRLGADVDPFVLSMAEDLIRSDKTAGDYVLPSVDARDMLED